MLKKSMTTNLLKIVLYCDKYSAQLLLKVYMESVKTGRIQGKDLSDFADTLFG